MRDVHALLSPATSIVQALGAAKRLERQTEQGNAKRWTDALFSGWDSTDAFGRAMCLHAMADVQDPRMGRLLTACLESSDAWMQEQAAAALSDRNPPREAVPGLLRCLLRGGAGAMFAQLALVGGSNHAAGVAETLRRYIETETGSAGRARMVETLGLLRSAGVDRCLVSLLREPGEQPEVRAAAARGLPADVVLANLPIFEKAAASGDAEIRLAVAEALADVEDERAHKALRGLDCGEHGHCPSEHHLVCQFARSEISTKRDEQEPTRKMQALKIVQVLLTGRLDPKLEGVGQGDSGGLATLMVSLARALGAQNSVEHAYTVARSFAGPGIAEGYSEVHTSLGPSASIVRLPFGPPCDLTSSQLWDYRARIERGLSRMFRRLGRVDGAHLRFADVTTYAALRVCSTRQIPVFFTLAPDPHAVIRLREQTGKLTRLNFAEWDRRESYLFRYRLVESLLGKADRLALFPRKNAKVDFDGLFGIDIERQRSRFWTVPEGVDTRSTDQAIAELRNGNGYPAAVNELRHRVRDLGEARGGRPMIVSVGRLHRVKGFHRLVEAWASDPKLVSEFNLLILGGNLENPNAVESEILSSIDRIVDKYPMARHGLLLFGHRPHRDVALLLAGVRNGLAPEVAPRGIYVCASEKEEFGLAILEAMATGLTVVGPSCGGPATYIADGENGFLARTTSVSDLRHTIHRAARARLDDVISLRGQRLVRTRFTIGAMAKALVRMYQGRSTLTESANAA